MIIAITIFSLLYHINSVRPKPETITFIQPINKTHFSCDHGETVLSLSKFNDDFCDCNDGSDENKTNACENGKFYCANRFYQSKIISTSKVNDGICDCCDGSDESDLNCPKTCIDMSTKELDKLVDQFLNLKMIVTTFNEHDNRAFFTYNKNLIEKIINGYHNQRDLMEKKFLLRSYLHLIENSMTEDDDNYIDSNGVSLKGIRRAIESVNEKLKKNDQFLSDHEHIISTFEKFSIFRDISEDCQKVKYKYYNCDMCYNRFTCTGMNASSKAKSLFFGHFVKLENNVAYFENGKKCGNYNQNLSAKIYLECGTNEGIKFRQKVNGCLYEFDYITKLGCNSIKLNSILAKISNNLNELK